MGEREGGRERERGKERGRRYLDVSMNSVRNLCQRQGSLMVYCLLLKYSIDLFWEPPPPNYLSAVFVLYILSSRFLTWF